METGPSYGPEGKYPVDLQVEYPEGGLSRLTTFFRIIVAIPILIIIGFLFPSDTSWEGTEWAIRVSGAAGFVVVPTAVMIIFREKYTKWWYDWNLALAGFALRVAGYLALLRDEYPSTDEPQAYRLTLPYPDVKRDLNRFLPLIKWFLAIPHYIVLFFLFIAAVIIVIISWFAILFTGRYPRDFFDFVTGVLRWWIRVVAYAFVLTTDRYPPFSLE